MFQPNYKEQKLWQAHLEAARNGLSKALGYNSVRDYIEDTYTNYGGYKPHSYSKNAARALRAFLPYCIQKTENENEVIILNRDYKPLGYMGIGGDYGSWLDYENFSSAKADIRDDNLVELIGGAKQVHVGVWFLFNDNNPPWEGSKYAKSLLKKIDKALNNKD